MRPDHWMLQSSDFHRCPNTGRVLMSNPSDDKVLCNCGRPAPRAVEHYKDRPEFRPEPSGVHCKVFIDRATAEEFALQETRTDWARQAKKARDN